MPLCRLQHAALLVGGSRYSSLRLPLQRGGQKGRWEGRTGIERRKRAILLLAWYFPAVVVSQIPLVIQHPFGHLLGAHCVQGRSRLSRGNTEGEKPPSVPQESYDQTLAVWCASGPACVCLREGELRGHTPLLVPSLPALKAG